LSSSSAANSSSASYKIPLILENRKVRYRLHKIPPPVRILNRINPVYALPYSLFNIQFDNTLQSTAKSSKWFFPSGYRTQILYVFIFSSFMQYDLPISLSLTLSPQQSNPYCAVVCSLLLRPLQQDQISSLAPYCQTPSSCYPSLCMTQLYTYSKLQE
jgi:hypothetical protein